MTAAARAQKALGFLTTVAKSKVHSKRLALMLFMTRSKLRVKARSTADFGNITGMVDDMVVIEEEEQDGDDKQQPWCNGEFEKEDGEEIAALTESIAELDKTVAKATEQRKEEHAEYTETIQLTQTAIELLAKAKNRLQK